ncbi:MAG: maltose O-acetyltransferase protein [Ferruginibacter sp.]|nr:maltose O-acetyltransferase protein [Ferruginibacter sp.]
MRENIIQVKTVAPDGRILIEDDWYPGGLPVNVTLADNVYIDTSYGFETFRSRQKDGLFLDEATGCYGVVSFIVSDEGRVSSGKFSVLNSTSIVCNKNITIGNHCMLAWGSVITDSWVDAGKHSLAARRELLYAAAKDPARPFPFFREALPVVIEDNCWVGFDAVILPGVTLGRGSVIGCKTVVDFDVPPYAVVSGSPAKIVKYLTKDDTEAARISALTEYLKA